MVTISTRNDLLAWVADVRPDVDDLEFIEAMVDALQEEDDHPAWGTNWATWLEQHAESAAQWASAVRRSEEQGRAWAEREAELARDQQRAVAGPWTCTDSDARPLVDWPVEDEGRRLATLTNEAAAARWEEIANANTWGVFEDGHEFATVEAETLDEAIQLARDIIDPSAYDLSDQDGEQTVWARIGVRHRVLGEDASFEVQIDPTEPNCIDDEGHDWQSPLDVVGGIKENPGVWGHGGGIIRKEACVKCGCGRTTDTWAQNPTTGEQGLTSIRYERGQFPDAVRAEEEEGC